MIYGFPADSSLHIDITMIRKNSLFCKLIRIKISSNVLFDSFMDGFDPEQETCPFCGATHSCMTHDSYGRNLIDFISGGTVYHRIRISRGICESCGHTHAILPDLIIPYSTYGVFFILRVIVEYLLRLRPVEQLCNRFGISHSMLYRWLDLFQAHKLEWLGLVTSMETSPLAFLKSLCSLPEFSCFASAFVRPTAVSFLQSHSNPASYRQDVF